VGALQRAMKHLDMALIMGGGGVSDTALEIVNSFEPRLVELLAAQEESADADEEGWVVSAECPPDAPEIPDATAIVRRRGLDAASFKKEHFKTDTPVVIEDKTEGWGARTKWPDLRYLKRTAGHRTVPVEMGRLEGGRKLPGWSEEAMPLAALVGEHLAPSNRRCRAGQPASEHEVAYLAQHQLFEQLPALRQDIAVPDLTEAGDFEGVVNAWIGTAGTVTPLHIDSYDNLLTQVVGFKYVRLYDHLQTKFLYVKKGSKETQEGIDIGAQGNISPITCESIDLVKHPLAAKAKYKETVLRPGDMLFIPSGHWHYVRSLTPSASVNFWF